jgi:NDP-sugar pyrophosphorylase family protein
VVLCTGYKGEEVRAALGRTHRGMELVYSQESWALGTAGALRLAVSLMRSDPVLVLNGDSFFGLDLGDFWTWHWEQGADATLALVEKLDGLRYGHVEVNARGAVTRFTEKGTPRSPSWINAGVYVISRSLILTIPPNRTVSLEREILPRWVGNGLCGYRQVGGFIDIGTPEAYSKAQAFFD